MHSVHSRRVSFEVSDSVENEGIASLVSDFDFGTYSGRDKQLRISARRYIAQKLKIFANVSRSKKVEFKFKDLWRYLESKGLAILKQQQTRHLWNMVRADSDFEIESSVSRNVRDKLAESVVSTVIRDKQPAVFIDFMNKVWNLIRDGEPSTDVEFPLRFGDLLNLNDLIFFVVSKISSSKSRNDQALKLVICVLFARVQNGKLVNRSFLSHLFPNFVKENAFSITHLRRMFDFGITNTKQPD